jgi:hypothetical protein
MKQKTWKNRQKVQRLFKKKGPWEEELGNHEMAGSDERRSRRGGIM